MTLLKYRIKYWIRWNGVPQRVLVLRHSLLRFHFYPQSPEKGKKEKNASVPRSGWLINSIHVLRHYISWFLWKSDATYLQLFFNFLFNFAVKVVIHFIWYLSIRIIAQILLKMYTNYYIKKSIAFLNLHVMSYRIEYWIEFLEMAYLYTFWCNILNNLDRKEIKNNRRLV